MFITLSHHGVQLLWLVQIRWYTKTYILSEQNIQNGLLSTRAFTVRIKCFKAHNSVPTVCRNINMIQERYRLNFFWNLDLFPPHYTALTNEHSCHQKLHLSNQRSITLTQQCNKILLIYFYLTCTKFDKQSKLICISNIRIQIHILKV